MKLVHWDLGYLVFSPGGLVGYYFGLPTGDLLTPQAKDLSNGRTDKGLRLGSSVAEAKEHYGSAFVLEETSLGPEFYIEDEDEYPLLGGFTDGLASENKITNFSAGDICAVR